MDSQPVRFAVAVAFVALCSVPFHTLHLSDAGEHPAGAAAAVGLAFAVAMATGYVVRAPALVLPVAIAFFVLAAVPEPDGPGETVNGAAHVLAALGLMLLLWPGILVGWMTRRARDAEADLTSAR